MNCRSARDYLQAYLDSELETAETLAVNQHLEVCDSCRRRFQTEGRLEAAIASHLRSDAEADERLFEQVLERVLHRRVARPRRLVRWLAAAALVVVAVLILVNRSPDVPELVRTAAADHLEYRAGRLAPDLTATTTEEVRGYLGEQLGVSCPDLPEGDGWRILGPRLCSLKGVAVGLVLLQHHGQPISLFLLTPDKAESLGWTPVAEPRCYPLREGHAVLGGRGPTVLCAVGTAPLADLEQLVTSGR